MYELITASPGPQPPDGLRADGSGRRLWKSVVGAYRLRVDELRILEDACFVADRIDYWHNEAEECATAASGERLVRGSQGQRRLNPLLGRADKAMVEERQNRAALRVLLEALELPDLDEDQPDCAATSVAQTA